MVNQFSASVYSSHQFGCTAFRGCLGQACTVSVLALLATFAHGQVVAPRNHHSGDAAGKPNGIVRELFVPFEELDVLLGRQAQCVYMTRAEFEDLKARANIVPSDVIPTPATWVSANYRIEVQAGQAVVDGELEIDVLDDGLQQLELQTTDVHITRASLDGQLAKLGANGNRGPSLFVEGKGRHALKLEMITNVVSTAAIQSMNLQLPAAPTAKLRLVVPGNIEIKSGATVLSRQYDANTNLTNFDLLPIRGAMQLVMSLNNRMLHEQSLLLSRSVLLDEITQPCERLYMTTAISVLQGATDQLRIEFPSDFEVSSVVTPLLSSWSIESAAARSTLVVKLRENVTDRVVLRFSLLRLAPQLNNWTLPEIRIAGVVSQPMVTALLVEEGLTAESMQTKGLIPIDGQSLSQSLAEYLQTEQDGTERLRVFSAYYTPNVEHELAVRFTKPRGNLAAATKLLLTMDDRSLHLHGGFGLMADAEKVFALDFSGPRHWQVEQVSLGDGTKLAFEKFVAEDRLRYNVRFPTGTPVGTQRDVVFQARHVPENWLSSWSEQRVEFPDFHVENTTEDSGAIAVQVADDLEARPESTMNLDPLSDADKVRYQMNQVASVAAYGYQRRPWSAVFAVSRPEPRVTAHHLSFFKFQSENMLAHYELSFQIEQARTQHLAFSFDESTPAEITIRGIAGTQIKEAVSTVANSRRIWTVTLARPTRGLVNLAVDFSQAATGNLSESRALPLPLAMSVVRQSGTVAIEGDPEFDISVENAPVPVDIGELVDAQYQVGRRLLGVYGYVGTGPAIRTRLARRDLHGIPATLVERAEMLTMFDKSGMCQTAARYQLKTKSQYFDVKLPDGAKLWTIQIDGKPATPQRRGSNLVIPLQPGLATENHDLQLVYETSVSPFTHRGSVSFSAPQIAERESTDSLAASIPIADIDWQIVLPNGYVLVNPSGNVDVVANVNQSWLQSLGNWSMFLGGKGPHFYTRRAAVDRSPQDNLVLAEPTAIQEYFADGQASSVSSDPFGARDTAITKEVPGGGMGRNFAGKDDRLAGEIQAGMSGMGMGGMGMSGMGMGGGVELPNAANLRRSETTRPETSELGRFRPNASLPGEPTTQTPQGPPSPVAASDSEAKQQVADPFSDPVTSEASSSLPLPGLDSQSSDNSPARATVFRSWVMEGIRGLPISLSASPNSHTVRFQSLGIEPTVQAVVIDQRMLTWLALTVAFGTGTIGFMLRHTKFRTKFGYVAFLLIAAIACPLVVGFEGEMEAVAQALLPIVLILSAFYAIHQAANVIGAGIKKWLNPHYLRWMRRVTVNSVVATIVCGWALAPIGRAQTQTPEGVDLNATSIAELSERLREQLDRAEKRLPVIVPDDVVVIPYDLQAPQQATAADKILVPYATYQRLWRLVHPDQTPRLPPRNYALSSAEYLTQLTDKDSLSVSAVLHIDVFVNSPVTIPLPFHGAVLEKATLDGSVAIIDVGGFNPQVKTQADTAPGQSPSPTATELRPATSANVMSLVATGPGRKRLEFEARVRVERRGGWRTAEAQFPGAGANVLNLVVPDMGTELRIGKPGAQIDHETSQPNQKVSASLGAAGGLEIHWRPKVAQSIADQTMSVSSESIMDIQEDGVRYLWHGKFDFPRARRSALSFDVPKDFMVERVVGSNIRGWLAKQDESGQRVEVQLLQAATDSEKITVLLSKYGTSHGGPVSSLAVPFVSIPESKLHQGEITLRRSRLLEIEVGEITGIRRTDTRTKWDWFSEIVAESPLPLEAFQTFQFSQTPYKLPLQITPVKLQFNVQSQTLLKVAEQETRLETRIIFDHPTRPIYQAEIRLPESIELTRPVIAGAFDWHQVVNNGERNVRLYFADGRSTTFSVILRGSFKNQPAEDGAASDLAMQPVDIPRIQISDATAHEGDVVIQAEPAFDIAVENLQQAQIAHLDSVYNWLDKKQQSAVLAAVHFTSPAYSGQLRVTKRKPQISGFSVTNVRVTDRAIEETIYIDYSILVTGVGRLEFLLPASMREAHIQAPLLRQKTLLPMDDRVDSPVRVRLDLQRDVMGQYRVVIANDRQLVGGPQEVPLPTILTGRTDRRLVTLENSGNDELVVVDRSHVDQLQSSQSQWKMLAGLLGEKLSEAYVVRDGNDAPRLVYATKSRAQVQTVGARIGLAKTSLIVDQSGAYRASQEFRVENRTEQYLEIALPVGSQLWTAWVANEPVKPIRAVPVGAQNLTSNQREYLVRIPLVKTAEGDLDYGVTIKYGGQIAPPREFQRVRFPLPRTTNIRVELSQVTLHLPTSHKWFNFSGTLGQVHDQEDLLADFLAFKGRQLSELSDMLSVASRASSFSRARAENNLRQLGSALQDESQTYRQQPKSAKLQAQFQANSNVLSQANQLANQATQDRGVEFGNRESLGKNYNLQQNGSSKGVVIQLDNNFAAEQSSSQPSQVVQFDTSWLGIHDVDKKRNDAEAEKKPALELAESDEQAQKRSRPLQIGQLAPQNLSTPDISRGLKAQTNVPMQQEVAPSRAKDASQRYLERLQSAQEGQQIVDMPSRQIDESLNEAMRAGLADNVNMQTEGKPITAGYLASLDVALPERGQVYYFSTPRGELELSAQSVSHDLTRRVWAIVTILTVCASAWIVAKVCQNLACATQLRHLVAVALICVALFSLTTMTLPVWGFVAAVVSLAMVVKR